MRHDRWHKGRDMGVEGMRMGMGILHIRIEGWPSSLATLNWHRLSMRLRMCVCMHPVNVLIPI